MAPPAVRMPRPHGVLNPWRVDSDDADDRDIWLEVAGQGQGQGASLQGALLVSGVSLQGAACCAQSAYWSTL